jgi:hypothetical protein
MKSLAIPLLAFAFAVSLSAQSAQADAPADAPADLSETPAEIPTEVSLPPYEVGDLVTQQGYYIERGEDLPKINFRIVENKLHLYWIDENGLIAEPEQASAIVRFTGSVRGRSFHSLSTLASGVGLGSPAIIVPPHLYHVVLVFPAPEGEEAVTHTFRYTPSMDVAVDPTVASQ